MSVEWIREVFEDPRWSAALGPAPERGEIVVVGREEIDLDGEVRLALASFGGEGWVATADEVAEVRDGELPPGRPLCAELVRGSRSLHLRLEGARFVAATLERREGEGVVRIEERVRQGRAGGTVRYEVLWEPGPDGLRPALSRLAGMSKGEGAS